jgi:hypothetical protein
MLAGADSSDAAVWVELTGVVGTARVRLEMIPDPPLCASYLCISRGR